MGTVVSSQLKMKYRNAIYGLATQSLNDPKEDLTGEQVQSAMRNIVDAGVFTTASGDFVSPDSAYMVKITEVQLF